MTDTQTTDRPEAGTDVALLRRVFDEATALLRGLEAVETTGGMDGAAKYLAVVNDRIEPLRRVVEDVEFHEKAKEVLGDYFAGKVG